MSVKNLVCLLDEGLKFVMFCHLQCHVYHLVCLLSLKWSLTHQLIDQTKYTVGVLWQIGQWATVEM